MIEIMVKHSDWDKDTSFSETMFYHLLQIRWIVVDDFPHAKRDKEQK